MKKVLAASVALVMVSGLAWAGLQSNREVQVNLTAGTASGSVYDARVSTDTVQYIGCMIYGSAGAAPAVFCDARNSQSERVNCSSIDSAIFAIAQGISTDSFISFSCDEDGRIKSLVVSKLSVWVP